jgi:hypothetical protein
MIRITHPKTPSSQRFKATSFMRRDHELFDMFEKGVQCMEIHYFYSVTKVYNNVKLFGKSTSGTPAIDQRIFGDCGVDVEWNAICAKYFPNYIAVKDTDGFKKWKWEEDSGAVACEQNMAINKALVADVKAMFVRVKPLVDELLKTFHDMLFGQNGSPDTAIKFHDGFVAAHKELQDLQSLCKAIKDFQLLAVKYKF